MKSILGKFNDGGPIFTYTIFILLLVIIAFFIRGLIKNNTQKNIDLIASISWFAVAWGFLGRTFGLIKAFDMVAAQGELTPRLLADGLKMALVDPLFGLFVFLIARVFIIILIAKRKDELTEQKV